jgi:quinoprotein glucose dehydrogenase
VFPNKQIADGFESVLITLKNGASHAGVLKGETAAELTVNSPEDGVLVLKKSDVTTRERGLSGMPEGMGQLLTKQELRDLIQFLGTLR